MKQAISTAKILLSVFLVICIAVHLYGLAVPSFNSEPVWSHIVHTISYTLCLVALAAQLKFRMAIYFIGMLYPFFYHARCAWRQYTDLHMLSVICILVVVLLPLTGWLVWYEEKAAKKLINH